MTANVHLTHTDITSKNIGKIVKDVVDFLKKSHFDLSQLEDIWVTQESMEGTYSTEDPIPLLFQAGYLTIKDTDSDVYKLGIPNGEVRKALVDDLIPGFTLER